MFIVLPLMYKRALGQDERSKRLRETIAEDENLNPKQKRRLMNSLLSTAVLTVDEMNELEIHEDSDASEPEVVSEDTEASSSEEEDQDAEIFKDKSNKSFRLCRHCPGKRMLSDEDVRKHLESKTHQKRKQKQLSQKVSE
jgi:hypothetical protein